MAKKRPGPKKGTNQVPAPERSLMLKMYYGGATYPEIAKAFGRHRNTVLRIAQRFKWKDKIKALQNPIAIVPAHLLNWV